MAKNKDGYLLRLIDENIDLHNQMVVYRAIIEKHGLQSEVNALFKRIDLPYELTEKPKEDPNGQGIAFSSQPYVPVS